MEHLNSWSSSKWPRNFKLLPLLKQVLSSGHHGQLNRLTISVFSKCTVYFWPKTQRCVEIFQKFVFFFFISKMYFLGINFRASRNLWFLISIFRFERKCIYQCNNICIIGSYRSEGMSYGFGHVWLWLISINESSSTKTTNIKWCKLQLKYHLNRLSVLR